MQYLNRNILFIAILLMAGSNVFSQEIVPLDRVEKMSFIENEYIKLGIDLNLGGAITYLADTKKQENLINNWDWGRQVQMSFYSGPVPFEPGNKKSHKAWTFIGWNPIQSGDVAGNKSKVLEHKNTGKTLYVKCIPMHWPLDNVPGECTYECWIQLDGNAVKVTSCINNNRPDTTKYIARGQELPAVYTNAPWHRLISYQGDKPFSNDTVSLIPNHNFPKDTDIRWASWQATESWAANVDEKDYGLGVWNAGVQSFSGGYYGDSSFKGGSRNIPTAYIAPNSTDILDYNITYSYQYALILGTIPQIRDYVYKHSKQTLPSYIFKSDRQQWYYQNTIDKGWPVKDGLFVQLKKNATMTGPAAFWKAAEAPMLRVEAAYPAGVKKAKVYWRNFKGSFSESQSLEFDIIADNAMHVYKIPLSKSEQYKGILSGLKLLLNAEETTDENRTVIIKAISLTK